jgi:hypothetical protein
MFGRSVRDSTTTAPKAACGSVVVTGWTARIPSLAASEPAVGEIRHT